MPWIWSALMPHPPVLLPEVGRGAEENAKETLRGLKELTKMLHDKMPDVLLLLSPHMPYSLGALNISSKKHSRGSFALYRAGNVAFDLETSLRGVDALELFLKNKGIPVRTSSSMPDLSEDQGTMVPLYFLEREWGKLPPVILASPIGLAPEDAYTMGRALAGFSDEQNWALLASGDLSHRLTIDAPAGYEPEAGSAFEAAVEESLKSVGPGPLLRLPRAIIERAGECGYRSVMAMLGLVGGLAGDIKVLSHEWPFGVGYCVAFSLLSRATPEGNKSNASDAKIPAPVLLARETVRRLLTGEPLPKNGDEVVESSLWHEHAACFVSIKKNQANGGGLRGCIGTLAPCHGSLDREIIENAVLASTEDPRFPAMIAKELDTVVFSVDVLSEPEAIGGIENIDKLDPLKWGVIVTKDARRGVLLPALEGVDTVEQQVNIAAAKAGIRDLNGIELQRFTVTRHKEHILAGQA